MKITTEKLPQSQVLLNIEIEPEVMERTLHRAYRRIANRTTIPGFRKGKAPRNLIERYVGRGALVEEALEMLIPEAYNEALETEQINAIAQPEIEVVQAEPPIFKATVAVRPTVELGDYRSLSFPKPEVEVTDADVDEELEHLRQRYAPWEPVEERPVVLGDLATIDMDSTFEDGTPFINDKDISYPVSETFPYPMEGFAAQLVGMEIGTPKTFTLHLPEDYAQPDMAGKGITFTVTIREIKGKKPPELSDEFAKGVGEGYETLDALRAWLRDQIREDKEREVRRTLDEEVVQAVVAQTNLEYPEVLVHHEIEHLLENVIPPALANNPARLEEYLSAIGKTIEEIREEQRPEAVRRVERALVLAKVTEEEQIEVGEGEIASEIARLVVTSGAQAEQMRQLFTSSSGQESIARMLRTRKTVERLVALVTGEPMVEMQAEAAAPEQAEAEEQATAEATAANASEQSGGPTTP